MFARRRLLRNAGHALDLSISRHPLRYDRSFVLFGALPDRRFRTRVGALLLLFAAGVLGGCGGGGGGHHNGTGPANQLIDLTSDVTVNSQPDAPNLTFTAGINNTLHFNMSNSGDLPSDKQITVTATLPNFISFGSYTSATAGAWTCSASGQTITCTSSASIPALANAMPTFTMIVSVAGNASGNEQLQVTTSTADGSPSSSSGAKGVNFTALTPQITSLSPTSGTGGTAVTISGSNFGASQGSSSVTFNGTKATNISTWTDTSIVADVPAGTTEGSGPVIVTVGGAASNSMPFTVTGPQITSLSPNSGAIGSSVTITGSGFGSSQGTSAVSFNGTNATTIVSWSDSSIVADVPSLATNGNVVVTVAGIPSPTSNSTMFTVTGAGGCANGGNAASLLTGDYAFGGQGFANGTTFTAVIGRFHADGSNSISHGLIQENMIGGTTTSNTGQNPIAFTGCFVLNTPAGASGSALGTLTLVNSSASLAMTLSIAIRANGNGNFITYDATSPQLSGALEKQCPNAANGTCPAFANSNVSGDYGFGFDGIDAGNATSNYGVAGQFTASSGSGTGVVDISSYAGVIALNDPFGVSGGVTDTANGLAQLDLNVTYNSGAAASGNEVTLIMDCYLANLSSSGVAGVMYCMSAYEASQSPLLPLLQGRFFTQNTPAGGWTNASAAPASNASVTWSTGIDGSGNSRVDVGQFTYNTSANPATVSISQDQNKGGSYGFQQFAEDISVASNGRVEANINGSLAAVCYLLDPGHGICVNEANNAALAFFVPQQAEPSGGFTTANFDNSFALGTLNPATIGALDVDGVLTAAGSTGTLAGTENTNSTSGVSSSSLEATFGFASAADAAIGRLTVPVTSPEADTRVFYIIDANTAVGMSTTEIEPAVRYLQH